MGFESFFAHACSFYSVLTNLSPPFSDTADLRRTVEFEIQPSQVILNFGATFVWKFCSFARDSSMSVRAP